MDADFYPIRRRGEKRRLNPNLPAIEWLETRSQVRTEIIDVRPASTDGLMHQLTRGLNKAAHDDSVCPRPMIQILDLDMFSGSKQRIDGCPDCDHWGYTAKCEEHPDEGMVSRETATDRACDILRARSLRDGYRMPDATGWVELVEPDDGYSGAYTRIATAPLTAESMLRVMQAADSSLTVMGAPELDQAPTAHFRLLPDGPEVECTFDEVLPYEGDGYGIYPGE